MHTERIHLLIVDESLADYHHEHPQPLESTGDYRVFADIVPRESNVQEYVVCDLLSMAPTGEIVDRVGSSTASAARRLRVHLAWNNGGLPIQARKSVNAALVITDENGSPFTQLEPVMGAYSHLVAFHEDHGTVRHIHPFGGEPQKPEDRGARDFPFAFGHQSPASIASTSKSR